ncbi:tyrosine-type recombinase/integrase [bacterium]|jgi:integrase|nr:tyrosine-type recombinase/integrase [bacterium]MDA7867219.1 tyrosine-type recombinase/integrase [Verrucomicrobiota bacterium]MDB4796777.1 tyrosine-type recombinase/integrase [bacterium]
MASLHQQHGKPNWFCAYTDASGKRHFKSTGTSDKNEAKSLCDSLGKAEKLSKKGLLSNQRARKFLEDALSDLMEATGESLKQNPTDAFVEAWLTQMQRQIGESTFKSYKAIVKRFLSFLAENSSNSIETIGIQTLQDYREAIALDYSTGTVNNHLKMLRLAFDSAAHQDLITRNPAKLVKNLARTDKQERRPFTAKELTTLLKTVEGDWKSAVMIGFYTGLRLGDIKRLTWDQVDLSKREINKLTEKTKRVVIIPLAESLGRYLNNLPAPKSGTGLICTSFAAKQVKTLSGDFHALLVQAKLVKPRNYKNYKADGKRREYSGLSFHCLRHNTTSALKNTGASAPITGDIVGHDSEAMSRNYTKIDSKSKREALDRLPDILEA